MSMKMVLAAALLAMPVIASAADADVCYSTPSPDPANQLTSSTVLHCPRVGNHTLPQLAQTGWEIVTVQPATASMADPTHPMNAWMVVIQKKGN
jgi:hypothetical protein